MSCRKDIDLGLIVDYLTCEWIESHDLFNLITKHLNTHGKFLIHWNDLDGISTYSEGAALKGHIVSLILHINKLAQQRITFYLIAHLKANHPVDIFLRRTKTIDARDCGNNNHIAPSQ